MWYSIDNDERNQVVPLSIERVKKIIELNQKGIIPDKLVDKNEMQIPTQKQEEKMDYQNVVGQDSLDRFSKQKTRSRSNKRRNKNRRLQNPGKTASNKDFKKENDQKQEND